MPLTAEERQEIEEGLRHYPLRSAASIDAMKIVQRHRGWVPDDTLPEIGELLGLSAHELDSVATFYNLLFRKPVGRHVILLCNSVSCWITGFPAIREAMSANLGVEFGETTPDDRFTFLPNVCLGACDRAPVMMVDDDLHTHLRPDALAPLLERYE